MKSGFFVQALINSIKGNIKTYNVYLESGLEKSADVVNNVQNCTAPRTINYHWFNPPLPVHSEAGFTPWCFYRLGGSNYGVPILYDTSQAPNIAIGTYDTGLNGSNTYVTTAQYNDPNNWQCFPIEIQAEAHCVAIPVKLKSVLKHFGIKVK